MWMTFIVSFQIDAARAHCPSTEATMCGSGSAEFTKKRTNHRFVRHSVTITDALVSIQMS